MKKLLMLGVVAVTLTGCSSVPVEQKTNTLLCRAYGFHMAMGEFSDSYLYESELKRRIQNGSFTKRDESHCHYEMRKGGEGAVECSRKGQDSGWCFMGYRMGLKNGK